MICFQAIFYRYSIKYLVKKKNNLVMVMSGFGFTQSPQRCKERNPDSYRDAAASQRTPREIFSTGH